MESTKWAVGIDLGGTTTKMAFVDLAGNIIKKWEIATDCTENGEHITADIANSIHEQLSEMGKPRQQLLGIGMGAPGFIDMDRGFIFHAVNIGWRNYPLQEEMEKASGLPVVIDNDANIAALGEMWKGAGNGAKDLLCVTVGTGVGGGVITNGLINHGVGGMAGEIGHLTVIPEGGYLCNCGRTGCLETVASATGIRRLTFERLEEFPMSSLQPIYKEKGDLSAKDVLDAARDLDPYATLIVEKVAFHLGLALSNYATILNPKKIVIGGGVSKAGNALLKPIDHYLKAYAIPRVYEGLDLVPATLGNDAGVIGGAWLIKEKLSGASV